LYDIRNLILLKVGGIREDPNVVLDVEPLWAFLFSGGKAMSNTQDEVKSSTPRPTPPYEFLETITQKNNALRAFGALLRTADLSGFDSGNYIPEKKDEAESLQWGLSGLIDLYLADLEQTGEAFADEYHDGDIWLIESASSTIRLFEEGMWNRGHIPMENFSNAIEGLNTVIARNPVLMPVAEAIKASIMKHIPQHKTVQNRDQGEAS